MKPLAGSQGAHYSYWVLWRCTWVGTQLMPSKEHVFSRRKRATGIGLYDGDD